MRVKHILFVTVAGFAPVTGMAADLPSTKSAPIEYVRVCNTHGTGYFYIPGTQTCLKIGGRARLQMNYVPAKNAFLPGNAAVSAAGVTTPSTGTFNNKNGIDSLGWYTRGHIRLDARTQSAFGTVQTFMDMRIESRSGHQAHNLTRFTDTNSFQPTLVAAYVRFAGLTFGRADEVFSFMPSSVWGSFFWSDYSSGAKQLAYTATLGQGFSATLALEDSNDLENQSVGQLGGITGGPFERGGVTAKLGPTRLPALVGNMRVDQGWGTFQIMGAVVENTANVVNPTALGVINGNGPVISKTGWAVGSGLRINLPMLAAGDRLHLTAGYAKGALGFLFQSYTSAPGTKRALAGLLRSDNPITLFGVGGTAGAAATGVAGELTSAFAVGGIFTHYWSPTVRSNFSASYISIQPGAQTRNTDWSKGGLSKANVTTTAVNLIWSPVSGLDIGAEVGYLRINQRLTGDNGGVPSALPAVAAATKIKPNAIETRFRVNRDF
jgi:hypothetical protein